MFDYTSSPFHRDGEMKERNPRGFLRCARRSQVSSATVLRIAGMQAMRHPQNCLKTIERRARLQKTVVGTPQDDRAFIVRTT